MFFIYNYRDRFCYKRVRSETMGWAYAVGKAYVDKEVASSLKGDTLELVDNLRVKKKIFLEN